MATTSITSFIKDKVVLVTGANRGIGKAFVEVFLDEGGAKRVYAAVRNLESLPPDMAKDPRITPLQMDLSAPETIAQAAIQAQDVDIVINNAGMLSRTVPLADEAVQQLEQEMTVNVYGFMHVARIFAPVLVSNNKDNSVALVQINSVASMRCGVPEVSTYSASKAAAYSMTQAIRQTLQPQGVRVLSVHPGPIATDMIRTASAEFAKQAEPPNNVARRVLEVLNKNDPNTFHIFPDGKSQSMGKVYESYGQHVIVDGNMYG